MHGLGAYMHEILDVNALLPPFPPEIPSTVVIKALQTNPLTHEHTVLTSWPLLVDLMQPTWEV